MAKSENMEENIDSISVIICVKNGESTIEKTLQSICKSNELSELIIIDGCSVDDSIRIAEKYTNKILSDEGKGLAYARQLGAENAIGEYVAYIDCDTEIGPGIIIKMVQEMQKEGWVAIHAQMIDPRINKTYWEDCENFHWMNRFNIPGKRDSLGTIVCVIKRKIINDIKFDSFFDGASEDADFYIRLKKTGLIVGVSNEIAHHFHRSSMKSFIKQRIWYGEGNSKIFYKHKSLNVLIIPEIIIIYGLYISYKQRTSYYIPFYFVWGISLLFGFVNGSIELIKNNIYKYIL